MEVSTFGVERYSPTIASSEQEAASTLVLALETVSRCLLSLTQAFGMIRQVRMQSVRHGVQNRDSSILIRYLLSLVVIPQLTLGAGLLLVNHAEYVYRLIALPLVLYCAPVVAIFGSAHFFTHGTLYPADLTGCALVVAFYTGLATIASAIHVLISHRARDAEPLRRANRRQPPASS